MPRKKKVEALDGAELVSSGLVSSGVVALKGPASLTPKRRRVSSKEETERRDALIAEYSDYAELVVTRIMRAMRLPVASKDDFISAGFLGLIEAASRYDNARGHEFQAYAYMRIRGAIIDYIRTSCELTGYAYRQFRALEAAQQIREAELEGRSGEPEKERFSKSQGPVVYLEKVAIAFQMGNQAEEQESDPEEVEAHNPEKVLQKKQRFQKIRSIVATLPEKERTIIEQYYFCDRKFVEVADQFSGLSKSWVSRLHDRALEMLREKMLEASTDIAA